jgi:DNA-binding NtrC family response regulator
MPPLRHRREDIPHLADYFLMRFNAEYDRPLCYLSEGALNKLKAYSWPGNVRELENCIRRAVLLSTGDVITEQNLMIPDADAEHLLNSLTREQLIDRLKEKLEEIIPEILRLSKQDIHANIIELVEEMLILKALQACGDNQVQAAKMLGISRNTLRHRLKKQRDRDGEDDKAIG